MIDQLIIEAWWRGEQAARAAGVTALTTLGWITPDQRDIRKAVTRWQKKRGHRPTGWLTRGQWPVLLEEAAAAAEPDTTDDATDDAETGDDQEDHQ